MTGRDHGTGYGDNLVHRFTYHPPGDDPLLPETYRLVRDTGLFFALLVDATTPPSREASLALTHIEEAVMWANAGLARRGLAGPAGLGAERLADHVWARMTQVCEDRDAPTNLQGTCRRTVDHDGSADYDTQTLGDPWATPSAVDLLRTVRDGLAAIETGIASVLRTTQTSIDTVLAGLPGEG